MLKPRDFNADRFAYDAMLPVFPLLAQQCLDDYQLDQGICLDIGSGSGHLGTEIAKITNMTIYYIDIDPQALAQAARLVAGSNIDNETHFIQADICQGLPLEDNFADFIISRGSMWFWKDQVQGTAEIYRVLKAGGTALIGGGLGRYVPPTMRQRFTALRRNSGHSENYRRLSAKELEAVAIKAGIPEFRIIEEEPKEKKGGWIEMHKPMV
ncbi:MAG: class I SAM-dependent methyltransferase [Syntrophomonadaceae bacterium]|nr:class I SAM-dependent methyltransferase [Syntrophomonadaceae bacterium]